MWFVGMDEKFLGEKEGPPKKRSCGPSLPDFHGRGHQKHEVRAAARARDGAGTGPLAGARARPRFRAALSSTPSQRPRRRQCPDPRRQLRWRPGAQRRPQYPDTQRAEVCNTQVHQLGLSFWIWGRNFGRNRSRFLEILGILTWVRNDSTLFCCWYEP
jgi:hypothetical protein